MSTFVQWVALLFSFAHCAPFASEIELDHCESGVVQVRVRNPWFALLESATENALYDTRSCIAIGQLKQCKPMISNPGSGRKLWSSHLCGLPELPAPHWTAPKSGQIHCRAHEEVWARARVHLPGGRYLSQRPEWLRKHRLLERGRECKRRHSTQQGFKIIGSHDLNRPITIPEFLMW